MREIKFRVWDTTSDLMRTDISSIDYDSGGNVTQVNVISGSDILFPAKECELMQYTGLKDKNGVEIYEGDIVKRLPLFAGDDTEIRQTEWLNSSGSFYPFGDGDFSYAEELDKTEVIGNIYEHPEPMK